MNSEQEYKFLGDCIRKLRMTRANSLETFARNIRTDVENLKAFEAGLKVPMPINWVWIKEMANTNFERWLLEKIKEQLCHT